MTRTLNRSPARTLSGAAKVSAIERSDFVKVRSGGRSLATETSALPVLACSETLAALWVALAGRVGE